MWVGMEKGRRRLTLLQLGLDVLDFLLFLLLGLRLLSLLWFFRRLLFVVLGLLRGGSLGLGLGEAQGGNHVGEEIRETHPEGCEGVNWEGPERGIMAIAAASEFDVVVLGSSGSDAPREKRHTPVVCPAARHWPIRAHVIWPVCSDGRSRMSRTMYGAFMASSVVYGYEVRWVR